ncbi:MAG: DUF362 domain-containing protein [Bacillota bacterium]|nr:DUF362 domain-containing protein [Bacillota bacterium]
MSQVSVSRCKSYEAADVEGALDRCLALLGGMDQFARRGETIVLKPNLLAPMPPSRGVTTHPSVMRALALRLRDAGARVVIADSPGSPVEMPVLSALYRITGMEGVASETGATLGFDSAEVNVSNPDGKFIKTLPLARMMAECDGIINVPKLKTHGFMVLTAGIKNMFGVVPGMRKSEFHFRMPEREMFGELLVDIALATRPRLTVLDAVSSMQGHGPTHGDLIHTGLLVASADVFALDLVAAHIAGMRASSIYPLKAAIARGLAPATMKDIRLLGETAEGIAHHFTMPRDVAVFNPFRYFLPRPLADRAADLVRPVPVFDPKVCTGCRTCFRQCPPHAIEMAGTFPQVNLKKCISCFCCQELCPTGAVGVRRRVFVRPARHK